MATGFSDEEWSLPDPGIMWLHLDGRELAQQVDRAAAQALDEELLEMYFGPVVASRAAKPNRQYTVQVTIPAESPPPVYRAFLEMMWRVSRLAKLPPDAVWSVQVIPDYTTSDEALRATSPTPNRLHRLTGTWGSDGAPAHDVAGC